MDCLREQFLARSAFSGDENVFIDLREPMGKFFRTADLGASAQYLRERNGRGVADGLFGCVGTFLFGCYPSKKKDVIGVAGTLFAKDSARNERIAKPIDVEGIILPVCEITANLFIFSEIA